MGLVVGGVDGLDAKVKERIDWRKERTRPRFARTRTARRNFGPGNKGARRREMELIFGKKSVEIFGER